MIEWEKYTWIEIKEKLKKIKAVILPVGSIEQHGPHLPLACDTLGAIKLSIAVAERLEEHVLILPPIYFGVSEHHMDFPGTITLSPETLISLVYDIANSLHRHSVGKMIIINGHGGNISPLSIAIRKIKSEIGIDVALVNPWELIKDVISKTIESDVWGHACEFETSLAFVEMPELIRREKIRDPKIKEPAPYTAIWGENRVVTPWRTIEFTDTGSIGYPTRASKEKGEKLWNAMVDRVSEFIKGFIKI